MVADSKEATSYHSSSLVRNGAGRVQPRGGKVGLVKQALNIYVKSPFAEMMQDYYKFGSQTNPLHASAVGHVKFNGDFFC